MIETLQEAAYRRVLFRSRERALELDASGLTVYVLHEDNTESMGYSSSACSCASGNWEEAII